MSSGTTLQNLGLRKTYARIQIAKLFEDSHVSHLSAKDVFAKLAKQHEGISLGTVYRVLGDLTDVGFLRRLHLEEGFVSYELNGKEQHDHLVCTKCHKVLQFDDFFDHDRYEAIARQHGFSLSHHSLVLYASCDTPACKKQSIKEN
ncbi:MAG: Fur family transcriptional regulator [Pseudomonadota bacterium]